MIPQDLDSEDGTVKGTMKKIPKGLGINGEVEIVVGKGIEFSQTEKRETNPVQKDQTADPEGLLLNDTPPNSKVKGKTKKEKVQGRFSFFLLIFDFVKTG